MPHLLAYKTKRRLPAITKAELDVTNFDSCVNTLSDYHRHPTCARLNVLTTLDFQMFYTDNTTLGCQDLKDMRLASEEGHRQENLTSPPHMLGGVST